MPIKYYYSSGNHKISDFVCPRLSLYYRTLDGFEQTRFISSNQLAEYTGVTAAQVRRDLTYFGHFGTPGKGYLVCDLKAHLMKIIGMNQCWSIALIGFGYLGTALLSWQVLRKHGYQITCAFDHDQERIGKVFEGIKIQDIVELESTVQSLGVQIAIIMVQQELAKGMIDRVIQAGINAILNFTPVRYEVPESVRLVNLDFLVELEKLTFFLNKPEREGPFSSVNP